MKALLVWTRNPFPSGPHHITSNLNITFQILFLFFFIALISSQNYFSSLSPYHTAKGTIHLFTYIHIYKTHTHTHAHSHKKRFDLYAKYARTRHEHDGFGPNWRMNDVSMSAAPAEVNHQLKAEIATHPLYEQLLSAHVACLRVATPIDQLPLIDAQLSQSHHILRSYAQNHAHSFSPHERQELDNFLVGFFSFLLFPFDFFLFSIVGFVEYLRSFVGFRSFQWLISILCKDSIFILSFLFGCVYFVWKQAQYLLVLCSFREQLQQHVRVHAVEAVMACREIEQNLQSLTGIIHLSLSISYLMSTI